MKSFSLFLRLLFVAAFLCACDDGTQDNERIDAVENGKEEQNNSSSPSEKEAEPQPFSRTGTYAEHDYVDLGLSVMWATCNVGAEKPEDYGKYFAWGDTVGSLKEDKHNFAWATYFDTKNNGQNFTIYNNADGKKVLLAEHDAANHIWGGEWRMPTKADFDELFDEDKIHSEWIADYKSSGKSGQVFYKKKEGEATYDANIDVHIFLPAAGFGFMEGISDEAESGLYWSSSLSESNDNASYYLSFYSDELKTDKGFRYYGATLRPVYHIEN